MKKVVINAKHGGFGLSHEGMLHYASLKGITLYPEYEGRFTSLVGPTYWLVPKEERAPKVDGDNWSSAPMEDRIASNEAYSRETLSSRDFARDDPLLVQTVETLGTAADGRHARLKVVEIPEDVDWEIDEYDGLEWVAEKHRTWG